jgi:hypothetical protein
MSRSGHFAKRIGGAVVWIGHFLLRCDCLEIILFHLRVNRADGEDAQREQHGQNSEIPFHFRPFLLQPIPIVESVVPVVQNAPHGNSAADDKRQDKRQPHQNTKMRMRITTIAVTMKLPPMSIKSPPRVSG